MGKEEVRAGQTAGANTRGGAPKMTHGLEKGANASFNFLFRDQRLDQVSMSLKDTNSL